AHFSRAGRGGAGPAHPLVLSRREEKTWMPARQAYAACATLAGSAGMAWLSCNAVLIGLVLAFVTIAPAHSQSIAELATYLGPDRGKRLIWGAERGDELMAYTAVQH